MNRRNFLKLAVGSVVVGGATLTTANFIAFLEQPQLVSVKVVYFQMQQLVNVTDEYFDLPTPASLRTLLGTIVQKHPSLSLQMMTAMLILVDDAPVTTLDDTLNEGDVVDFVPLVAGG